MTKISLLQNTTRHYDIYIDAGLLKQLPTALNDIVAEKSSIIIICDSSVAPLYLDKFKASLTQIFDGLITDYTVPEGEGAKSFAQLESLCEKIIENGVERDSLIIALGGGVIGDLAGFTSAIILRGIDFIQIPTTLLAMVDSSVGGKTGINLKGGKNLIGAFHQPRMVIQDIDVLKSLPHRHFLAGYAEILKYALINDLDFFQWLDENGTDVINGSQDALIYAIGQSCKAKARIVDADEKEKGKRMLLNLGHTFAHALEAFMGYDGRLFHGEAVAIGMNLAFHYSKNLGLCDHEDCDLLKHHYMKTGLPLWPQDIAGLHEGEAIKFDANQLTDYMRHDKKVKQGKLTLILTRGIGKSFVSADNSLDNIHEFWTNIINH